MLGRVPALDHCSYCAVMPKTHIPQRLSIQQLIAICDDIKSTLDAMRVLRENLPADCAADVLVWRLRYLRDIKKLLERSSC